MPDNKPRKSPGEGFIRELPSGRFHGELTLGRTPDGRRNIFRVTCDSMAQVRNAFRQAHRDYEAGQLVTSARQTVGQFLHQWLTDTAKSRVSPVTFRGYQDYIDRHVIPVFGSVRMASLTPAHVQRLYKAKLETLSAQSVLHLHRTLHTAFEQAVRWELMRYNVCDRVDPPRVEQREQHAFTKEQAVQFYKVCLADSDYGPYFITALCTGMRMGEMYALQWDDVDWQQSQINVRHAYSRLRGTGRLLKGTKTGKCRVVPLLPISLQALERQRHRQKEYRIGAGPNWAEQGLVFATRAGGPLSEGDMRLRFLVLLAQAGLPTIRPYDLRHSATSLYLALGVQPKDVSALLGHSTIATTMNVYAQSYTPILRAAMERFDDLLSNG